MSLADRHTDVEQSSAWQNFTRAADFWRRATTIYTAYKVTQLRSLAIGLAGSKAPQIRQDLWHHQHVWAGEQMYDLAVSLRGFYLKAGQFIGARADFIPDEICRKLSLLHDKVPPMPAAKAEHYLKLELGVDDLAEVFEWIDLEQPLGSASISQVHKAQLRHFTKQQLSAVRKVERRKHKDYVVQPGEDAWDICNRHGVSLEELQRCNKGHSVEKVTVGQTLRIPVVAGLDQYLVTSSRPRVQRLLEKVPTGAAAAVAHAIARNELPKDGLVAVKLQYPDAARTMAGDLVNLHAAAAFLQRTEIKFDLVSAVEELQKQIHLEFDFLREARVMDTIAHHLRRIAKRVRVPRSVHGLVTQRLLVMDFIEGTPLMQLGDKVKDLPEWKRKRAARKILTHVSEAYGRMMLGEGLFQADGHPGNVLIRPNGSVALLDYGQSKQLTEEHRRAFAELVLALNKENKPRISSALANLGVETGRDDVAIRSQMAYGMFDTRGKVNPFDKNSPIKQVSISRFPRDLFFVLRVVQLLRGLSEGMGVDNFSTAAQWAPFARDTLRRLGPLQPPAPLTITDVATPLAA